MTFSTEPHREPVRWPSVSVVIPVFNDPEGIRGCLAALSRQDYPDSRISVLVVDNGSDPRLSLDHRSGLDLKLLHCATPGAYAARNAGVADATGEVLVFTDADCLPDPDWLREGVQALMARGGSDVVGGDVLVMQPERRNGTGLYQFVVGFQQRENISGKHFSATANLFCWRHQFDKIGAFEERLFSGADREWAWRASTRGIGVTHAESARVRTRPRPDLRSAIRQARRVAAGRQQLASRGLTWKGPHALAPHRTGLAAAVWIARQSELTRWERARMLVAAATIRIAAALEVMRLRVGGKAERR